MKVDVIVKQAFVDDLRAELNTGGLNPNDYLTARFTIPEVFVSSTPTQNDQPRDLYQAPVDLGAQPLRFEKDGETIHKLRPVEAYVVDDQGNRIDSGVNNPAANIRTGQVWQLQQGEGGIAIRAQGESKVILKQPYIISGEDYVVMDPKSSVRVERREEHNEPKALEEVQDSERQTE